jgi:hypothetical protein
MASHLDLKDLFERCDRSLAALERQHGASLWRAVRGGPPPDAALHASRLERLLTDDSILARLEAVYRRESADPGIRRRASLWLSAALSSQAERQAGMARHQRAAGELLASYAGTVGRERPGPDDLRQILCRDASRDRREAAYTSLLRLGASILPSLRDALGELARAWLPSRPFAGQAAGYWTQPLSPFALRWPGIDVPAVAREFLDATAPLLDRFLHLGARSAGVTRLRPWDWDYAQHRMAAGYDRFLPAGDLLASLSRGLRTCGLVIDSQPIHPELAPRWMPPSRSGLPPVEWLTVATMRPSPAMPGQLAQPDLAEAILLAGARPPRPEVGVAVECRQGTQQASADLARAVGAALGVLLCRAGHLAERLEASSLGPAGAVLAQVTCEPGFLGTHTKMARSDIDTYVAIGCRSSGLLRAVRLRQAAALAATAWQVMLEPGTDPGPVAQDWLRRATGMSWDASLAGLDLATLGDPAWWPGAFLAELAAGQVAGHLRSEHGRLTGDRRTGECLVECFWRQGAMVPFTSGVRMATGREFSPRAEAQALAMQAGG